MLGLDTLDVAIGLILLFLATSLICTSVRETLEGVMKTRAADLEKAMRELLGDDDQGTLTRLVYEHPMISSLFRGSYIAPDQTRWIGRGGKLPSYIPSGQFARAILDLVAQAIPAEQRAAGLTVAALRVGLTRLQLAAKSGAPAEAAAADRLATLRTAVQVALDHAGDDLSKAQGNLEAWFNGTMDRAAGWYRRRTQTILFVIGLIVAITLNIDAIAVADRLISDKPLRDTVVARAQATAKAGESTDADFGKAREELTSIGLPIGWSGGWPAPQVTIKCPNAPGSTGCVHAPPAMIALHSAVSADGRFYELSLGQAFKMLVGWLTVAVAVTLGAAFWFDALNKVMVVRSTVKPTQKSPDEASEDRPAASAAK